MYETFIFYSLDCLPYRISIDFLAIQSSSFNPLASMSFWICVLHVVSCWTRRRVPNLLVFVAISRCSSCSRVHTNSNVLLWLVLCGLFILSRIFSFFKYSSFSAFSSDKVNVFCCSILIISQISEQYTMILITSMFSCLLIF